MNQALKVIEAQVELVYNELKRVSADRTLNQKAYELLKQATVDAIDLKRIIELARLNNQI